MTPTARNSTPRLLGIFAHPDDETFCAGGTLAKYVDAGAEAMVASFTRGGAGQIRDARAATRRTLPEVRDRELRAACKALGVQHVTCLDYGDGTLKDVDPKTLVGEAVSIIRRFRPDVVFTFGEEGASGHPDHITIGRVATEACRLAGHSDQFPDGGLPAHAPASVYHSRFPRSRLLLMDHLAKWLVSHGTRFRGSLDFIQGLMLFAGETNTLGYNSDHIRVAWYPPEFYIIEQGEPATSLYLILSGEAEVFEETPQGDTVKVARVGPGEFVGELGLAHGHPRSASVISRDSVTCLVLSADEPTAFAGRGEGAQFAETAGDSRLEDLSSTATTCIDVTDYVGQKMAAVAAHRTQYRLSPDLFPQATLREMLGHEYFIRVYPPVQPETDILPA